MREPGIGILLVFVCVAFVLLTGFKVWVLCKFSLWLRYIGNNLFSKLKTYYSLCLNVLVRVSYSRGIGMVNFLINYQIFVLFMYILYESKRYTDTFIHLYCRKNVYLCIAFFVGINDGCNKIYPVLSYLFKCYQLINLS